MPYGLLGIQFWQALLDGLGAVLAYLYNLIPNYGIAIIILTLAIRVVLLPLAIKQIRSMQAMQVLQPKLKEIQKKYKGNRQKINEETMALYKEYGANPLSGCLPLLLQFPVLIALYAIIRFPNGLAHIPHSESIPVIGRPQDSRLYVDILNQKTHFLGVNLLCSASQAGSTQKVVAKGYPDAETELKNGLDCGHGIPSRIPYYLFAAAMIATTYYQQRQMQRASPSTSQQQQALTRIMPILFGFWGFIFPAGLVLYWTTTNLVQIGQQHFMLPKLKPDVDADVASKDGRKAVTDGKARARGQQPQKGSTGRGSSQTKGRSPSPQAKRANTARSGDGGSQVRGRLSSGKPATPGRLSGGGGSGGTSQGGGSRSSGNGGSSARGTTGGQSGTRRKKRRKR